MSTNLVILAGIPGCGKSTWAKHFFDLKYKVVSSDEIRKRMFGGLRVAHTPAQKTQNNAKVFAIFHREITTALGHGIDVIADATNLNRAARKKLRDIAKETGAQVHLVLFKNIFEATNRNALRDNDSRVPEEAMYHMMRKYWDTLAEIAQEGYASVTEIERYQ